MANHYDEKDVREGSPHGSPISYDSPRHHEQEHMSAGRYIATRFSTLKPPMAKAPNPIALLRMLNLQQWMFFLVAFLAWSWVSLILRYSLDPAVH